MQSMWRHTAEMTATVTPFPRAGATPSQAPSLHEGLLDALRILIDQGDLLPGARVPERALCERFNVSRTPLRECLKVLAAEGLVQLLPNRGARIATLGDEHLVHLFEVIAALEAEGGRLACERITPDALAEIQGLHYRMYAHFLRAELPEYFSCNQAIHEGILRAAANPVLLSTYASLAGRITRARYMSNRIRPDRWKQAMDEHGDILAALVARDGAELGRLLARHLQGKRDIIMGAINEASGTMAASPASPDPGSPEATSG
jgi:DNA-binding GntR family transcriptional regulator